MYWLILLFHAQILYFAFTEIYDIRHGKTVEKNSQKSFQEYQDNTCCFKLNSMCPGIEPEGGGGCPVGCEFHPQLVSLSVCAIILFGILHTDN